MNAIGFKQEYPGCGMLHTLVDYAVERNAEVTVLYEGDGLYFEITVTYSDTWETRTSSTTLARNEYVAARHQRSDIVHRAVDSCADHILFQLTTTREAPMESPAKRALREMIAPLTRIYNALVVKLRTADIALREWVEQKLDALDRKVEDMKRRFDDE